MDDILLSFGSDRPFILGALPSAVSDEGVVGDSFGPNEAVFKISVDDAGGFGGGVSGNVALTLGSATNRGSSSCKGTAGGQPWWPINHTLWRGRFIGA